ncbi:MAG: hypothetical protein UT63_C0004G0031 [Candidatus Gottesmanbacteria bacterium GW2011_GWC2_39_8]|uniref:Integral membrane protein n=1 Tax=Candidatus Gottesmanbacteria bacterium GW2011_GWC2_39_8 TaxID=1618450 RepID=A0A0G0Q1K4_9BACT|nr:MAG: hypothetical protein UT63_C0004G0031 [Candidatus Gottesmanbacteria bacterium GW2011_GWC2_39_8]
MPNKSFPLRESFSYGWNTTKNNFQFFFGILLIYGIMNLGPTFIERFFNTGKIPLLNLVIGLIFGLTGILISLGKIGISLKVVDGKKAKWNELFSYSRLFLTYITGNIFYTIILALGYLFFILPGIYLSLKYQFFPYFLVDKKLSLSEAFKESGRITEGKKWNVFLFNIVSSLYIIIGALALGIGLLWTVPTTWLATAYLYRKLSENQ